MDQFDEAAFAELAMHRPELFVSDALYPGSVTLSPYGRTRRELIAHKLRAAFAATSAAPAQSTVPSESPSLSPMPPTTAPRLAPHQTMSTSFPSPC